MILLDIGIFGLGFAEMVVVIIALLLLLSPKDFALIKPIVKAVYKGWLEYRGEVESAQKDMEELKHSVMKPLEDAEREVETELVKSKAGLTGMRKTMAGAGAEMRKDIATPIQQVRGGIGAAGKDVGAAGKAPEAGLAGMRRGFAGPQARQAGLPAQEAKGAAPADKAAETGPPEGAARERTEPAKRGEVKAGASGAKPESKEHAVKSEAKPPERPATEPKAEAKKKKGENI